MTTQHRFNKNPYFQQALRERMDAIQRQALRPKLLAMIVQSMFRNGLPQGWK